MSKADPSRDAPEEVDAYLQDLAADTRSALERLRGIVREVAPQSTERISYGAVIFRLGKDLVGISAQKDHCSFHSMSPSLMRAMADELRGFKVSGATLHFTPDKPLPRDLVERVVSERMKELGFVS